MSDDVFLLLHNSIIIDVGILGQWPKGVILFMRSEMRNNLFSYSKALIFITNGLNQL
jgi:hypothetical protein